MRLGLILFATMLGTAAVEARTLSVAAFDRDTGIANLEIANSEGGADSGSLESV